MGADRKGKLRLARSFSIALLILLSISSISFSPIAVGHVKPAHLVPQFSSAASSSGVWWVGSKSTDASALPNTGVEANIQVASQSFSGCLSFWVSESELSNGNWGQVGYYICSGSTPTAFYQIWNIPQNVVLSGGSTSVSTGAHVFSMYATSGTTWTFALDGKAFGTYNMGSTQTTSYPVYALSEQSSVASPQPISQVEFYTSMNVLRNGVWQPVATGTSYGTSWGVAGRLQNSQWLADQIIVGGGLTSLSEGTPLWSGSGNVLRSSSTSVTCSPSSLQIGSSSTCTATVKDTASGTAVTPTGKTSFTSSASGSFSSTTCTLAGAAGSSTCAVTYKPSGGSSGTNTITATYGGDTVHSTSTGSFALSVNARTTSTTVSCSPSSVAVNVGTACTVTVSDTTSSGTKVTPTGGVTMSSTGPGGFTVCNLSGSAGKATCTSTYTPGGGSAGTTPTITAKYAGDTIHSGSSGTFVLTVLSGTSSPLALDGSVSGSLNTGTSLSVMLTTTSHPDLIIVVIGENTAKAAATPTVTSTGLSFALRTSLRSGSLWIFEYYAVASNPLSSQKILVSMSQAAVFTVTAFGVSGASTTSPFDPNASLPKTSSGLWGTNHANTATTSNQNDFIFYAEVSSGNPTYTPLGGYNLMPRTIAYVSSWMGSAIGYKIVSTTQDSATLGFTLSVGQTGAQIVDAIK